MDEQDDVIDIVSQLRDQSRKIHQERKTPVVNAENMAQFVIDNAATIITESVELIQELSPTLGASADAELIEASAELFRAASGAISILSNININKEKLKSQKELRLMEIESRKEEDPFKPSGDEKKFIASREEVYKLLNSIKKEKNVIDV